MFRRIVQKSVKASVLFNTRISRLGGLAQAPHRYICTDIDKSTDHSEALPYSLLPPLILDGSVNMELDPSCDTSTTDTRRAAQDALLFSPGRIQKVHEKYLNSGCNIITTSNFSVSPFFLSNFDFAENWRRPGSDWKYGDTVAFQSHWPTQVNSQNLCRLPVVEDCVLAHEHVARDDSGSNGSDGSSMVENITLEQQQNNEAALPPAVVLPVVTPKAASAGIPQCFLPDLTTGMYQSPRLDCLVKTPLTKLFDLTALSGTLAVAGLHTAPLAEDASESPVDKIIGQWRRKRIIAGSVAPLFGPSDVQLHKLYREFEVNKKPSVLLETLWALAEYADGFKLKNGQVSNLYDSDSSLQPPARSIHQCDGSLGVLTAPEVAASLYRGVVLSQYNSVDMFLCESIPSIKVAETMSLAAMTADKPVMVSFQQSGDDYGVPRLVSCETLAQAVDRLLNVLPRFVSGYSVNCSNSAIITSALPILRSITKKPVGAYAKLPYCHYGSKMAFEHTTNLTNSPLIRRKHMLEEILDAENSTKEEALPVDHPVDAVCEHSISSVLDMDQITLSDLTIDRTSFLARRTPAATTNTTNTNTNTVASSTHTMLCDCPDHDNTSYSTVMHTDETDASTTAAETTTNTIDTPTIDSLIEELDDDISNGNTDYTSTSPNASALSDKHMGIAAQLVYRVENARPEDLPRVYAELASFWASDLKADIIGGCCGISSVHAKQMSETVEKEYRKKLEKWFQKE